MYFDLLDCFPFFLHFLIPLINFILWVEFLCSKRQAEDMGGVSSGKASQGPAQIHTFKELLLQDIIASIIIIGYYC